MAVSLKKIYIPEGSFYKKLVDSLKIALQSSLLEHMPQHLFTNTLYYNVCMYLKHTATIQNVITWK